MPNFWIALNSPDFKQVPTAYIPLVVLEKQSFGSELPMFLIDTVEYFIKPTTAVV